MEDNKIDIKSIIEEKVKNRFIPISETKTIDYDDLLDDGRVLFNNELRLINTDWYFHGKPSTVTLVQGSSDTVHIFTDIDLLFIKFFSSLDGQNKYIYMIDVKKGNIEYETIKGTLFDENDYLELSTQKESCKFIA